MSHTLIDRSADLRRLREEGFEIEIVDQHLVMRNVPYVDGHKQVRRGTLVSTLAVAGDVTRTPDSHLAFFDGGKPCHKDGSIIQQIQHQDDAKQLGPSLKVQRSFSNKPKDGYPDYYAKMTQYMLIISGPAAPLEPGATAQTYAAPIPSREESVFEYMDTASSRAGIVAITSKLEKHRIAVVGVGGTGSYVLDLLAKTPVAEIHIYDDDEFRQHNAFRSPGAPALADLKIAKSKVEYFAGIYRRMHRHVIPHEVRIDESNVEQLRGLDFVFLCVDNGVARRLIAAALAEMGVRFIDVGISVEAIDKRLLASTRIQTYTPELGAGILRALPTGGVENNDYSQNIQIADLNALNATLAVIRWKKLLEFYVDQECENSLLFDVGPNLLTLRRI